MENRDPSLATELWVIVDRIHHDHGSVRNLHAAVLVGGIIPGQYVLVSCLDGHIRNTVITIVYYPPAERAIQHEDIPRNVQNREPLRDLYQGANLEDIEANQPGIQFLSKHSLYMSF